ncbi:MAG: hypothetical protein VYE45_00990, partial [Pseudomonadota bacterium]|nr:hypothetical protein [Pseudomonadota bacterium]
RCHISLSTHGKRKLAARKDQNGHVAKRPQSPLPLEQNAYPTFPVNGKGRRLFTKAGYSHNAGNGSQH